MKNSLKLISVAFLFCSATASAELIPLNINGVSGTPAYYDTVLDITWLADWNLAQTNQFGLPLSTRAAETVDGIVSATGKMSWNTANSWIAGINQASYLGASNWRLPTMQDSGISGCGNNNSDFQFTNATDCGVNVLSGSKATTVYSELASVVYDTLDNSYQFNSVTNAFISSSSSGFHNPDSFTNILNSSLDFYWFNVEDVSNTNKAWTFYPRFGSQRTEVKSGLGLVVAVANGNILNISAVPEPNSLWLFCVGLLMLVFARKNVLVKLSSLNKALRINKRKY